jgi:hypothetical protein
METIDCTERMFKIDVYSHITWSPPGRKNRRLYKFLQHVVTPCSTKSPLETQLRLESDYGFGWLAYQRTSSDVETCAVLLSNDNFIYCLKTSIGLEEDKL